MYVDVKLWNFPYIALYRQVNMQYELLHIAYVQ